MTEPVGGEREGTWAKLRRRKVVQWGIAYAAGAWGLLQGLGFVTDTFHWPEQLQQLVTIALLVGLPMVLVIAWYHGDRGQQRVTATELVIITLLFLIGGGIFWRYDRAAVTPTAPASKAIANTQATGAGPVVDQRPSIAVLPFVNMSADKDNEYFSDGISEELLNVLVRVEGIGVASRTSSFAYKGRDLGAAAIAKELQVNHILEGSVRRSGNRVRITAQLIDATNDRHLWSETYDRELNDIFAIQDEIANAIVGALRGTLGAETPVRAVTVRADTENLKAYDLYLKARELFIARSDLKESVRLFEQAVELDPQFARGWEGLAAVCAIIEGWGILDRDYMTLAEKAAKRALELDATLSMPWAALGMAGRKQWPIDYARTLELLDRAIAADPKNATAYLWRSIPWMELGFFDRAIADQDRCLKLEPGYHNARRHKALALLQSGQTDAAFALFERGVAAGFVVSRSENFVGPLIARGNVVAALLLMESMGFPAELRDVVVESLQRPGAPHADNQAIIDRYLASPGEVAKSVGLSHLYLWLGEFDRIAASDDNVTTAIVAWDRYPPAFRNSAGFKKKLERMGVATYWRAKGFPPQCRAVGKTDFTCDS